MRLLLFIFILFFFLFSLLASIRVVFSTPEIERFASRSLLEQHKVVFFGDSVLKADHLKTDNIKYSLVEHLERDLKVDILEVSSAAYNPIIYLHLLKALVFLNPKVETIIIPINLRAFSSSWLNVPEYQFEQECSILSIIYLEPNFKCIKDHMLNLLFKDRIKEKRKQFLEEYVTSAGFLKTTKRRFFDENTCKFNQEVYTCENMHDLEQSVVYLSTGLKASEIMIPMRFNYHYGENIGKENRSLTSLIEINEFVRSLNKKVIFYITPHNMGAILKYSGVVMSNMMDKNIEKVSFTIKNKNVYFTDFSDILDESHFDLNCACEHIDNQGKDKLAKSLSEFLITVGFKIGSK